MATGMTIGGSLPTLDAWPHLFRKTSADWGGGAVELMVIGERFGRHLVTGPFLASVILGGHAVLFAGSTGLQADVLPGVAGGTSKLALAYSEHQARYDLHDVATVARPSGSGYVLSGQKDVVLHGPDADLLIVSARTSGNRRDRDGITLLAVPADSPGVVQSGYRTHDANQASTILFDSVEVDPVHVLAEPDRGIAVLERVIDHAIAFGLRRCGRLHVAGLRDDPGIPQDPPAVRSDTGVLQALQHRMVDVYMDCELAWSMVLEATHGLSLDASERRRAVSSAKVAVGEAAGGLPKRVSSSMAVSA